VRRRTDASAAKACNRQATADAKDALMTCQDQRDARLAVCARLGPAPYAPAIDPANFVDATGNPLPITIHHPLFRGRRRRVWSTTNLEAHPAVGDFYRQEFLLKDAEDLAEVNSRDGPGCGGPHEPIHRRSRGHVPLAVAAIIAHQLVSRRRTPRRAQASSTADTPSV
jgi:hypothetical protein